MLIIIEMKEEKELLEKREEMEKVRVEVSEDPAWWERKTRYVLKERMKGRRLIMEGRIENRRRKVGVGREEGGVEDRRKRRNEDGRRRRIEEKGTGKEEEENIKKHRREGGEKGGTEGRMYRMSEERVEE